MIQEADTFIDDGKTHYYRNLNQVQLNKKNPDFRTNFIEHWETDKKRKQQHFSWITDIQITNDNVFHIMRGGRSNWVLKTTRLTHSKTNTITSPTILDMVTSDSHHLNEAPHLACKPHSFVNFFGIMCIECVTS